MITGTVWGFTLLIAGFIATLAATQVLFASLFPARLAATRRALRVHPVLTPLVGAPVFVLPLAIAIAVAQRVQLAGALGIAAISLLGVFGLGAVALEVGSKLPSEGPAASGWRAMIRGSVVVSLASLLPVAGWFLVWPLTVFAGVGAWTMGLFMAAPSAAPAPDPDEHVVPARAPAPVRAPEPAEATA